MNTTVTSHGVTAFGSLHEAFARLRGWKAHGVAFLLGALGAFAFAPFHFSPILVFSFTGIIWMIDGARGNSKWGKFVFARGWAFGFGFFFVGLHWTVFAFLVDPERYALLIPLPLLILPAGLALIWGAGAALAGAFWSASPSRVFVFAIFMSLAEYVRGHLFGGFPWNLPGTTWMPGGAMSQAASIGGIYWLTLLTIFVMSTPAALVDTRERNGIGQRMLPALLAVILVGGGWAWGAQRLSEPTVLLSRHVTLMDVGVPQAEKWEVNPTVPLRRYLRLLEETEQSPSDIVIWPEAAVPMLLLQEPDAMDAVSSFIGDRTLIMGTARRQPVFRPTEQTDTGQRRTQLANQFVYYNSLAVLTKESARSGPLAIYDKHRLVPFGELSATSIVPFGNTLKALLPSALQQAVPDGFSAGPGPKVVSDQSVLPPFNALICYEGLYPSIPRHKDAGPRADWMVIISNDGWFGPTTGPAQHYAQNRYRAIETGLPLARVASRGTTAMIDGFGRQIAIGIPIAGDQEGWRSSVVRTSLPQALAATPYYRRGDILFFLNFIAFSLLAFLTWRR